MVCAATENFMPNQMNGNKKSKLIDGYDVNYKVYSPLCYLVNKYPTKIAGTFVQAIKMVVTVIPVPLPGAALVFAHRQNLYATIFP